MLRVGERESGDGQGKKEGRPARESTSCRDTAASRRSASVSCAVSYCAPRHGSPSFFMGRSDRSALTIADSAPPAGRFRSILGWSAGIIIEISIQRIQLLINLRVAIQQLQIAHGGRFRGN